MSSEHSEEQVPVLESDDPTYDKITLYKAFVIFVLFLNHLTEQWQAYSISVSFLTCR